MALDSEHDIDPYLLGHYAPVLDERIDHDLEILGDLPEGLVGSYLRNGGNPQFPPIGRYHVFDGDGMVHAVTFDGEGGAHYRNRFVESKGLLAERRAGHALFGGLAEFALPPEELLAEVGFFKNTANTNIIRHGDRLLALMEAAHPTELDSQLRTVGEFTYGGTLQGPMTAHPRMDAATGEMCFFGYSPFPPYLRYHVVSPAGELVRSVDIDVGRSTMMHDFVITDRHVLFFDLPALFDLDRMMAGQAGIHWDGDAGARIGIMPRDGGTADVSWIEIDPCYVFHFMSAQELPDGRIDVVGCRATQMPISFGDDPAPAGDVRPTLHRWLIDPVGGTVRTDQLDDRGGDFPRINDDHSATSYRYGYLGNIAPGAHGELAFNGITKWDLSDDTEQRYDYGDAVYSGEPVFAADPAGTAEDDGWVLNFVTDHDTLTTSLVVLDASDVTGGPVCEVRIPRRVPFGFHGNWMPGLQP